MVSNAPLASVVCIDETSRQLMKETCIPCVPGQVGKADYGYVCNRGANVFMVSELLTSVRETVVIETRIAVDFA